MNKKMEDVKMNHIKRIIRIPKEEVPFVDVDNHNPTYRPGDMGMDIDNTSSSSKYEFLNKISSKSQSSVKRMTESPQMPKSGRPFNKSILTIFLISLAVGVIYFLSTTFLQARVNLVTKNKTLELKHQKFTASNKLNGSNVLFELMIVSDSDYKDTVLTNAKEASEKAKGEIYLYNEYSTKAQKIGAGSFLSDENGKTYKLDKTTTIPGYTLDKSKKIIPGQVATSITAFLPGEMYNGNPKSFYINLFKGTDKYKKMYGKAKTPMDGGMSGLVYLLGDKEKNEVSSNNNLLKEKLLRKLSAQVPEGYILYKDAVVFSYEYNENVSSKTPDTKIEVKGTLSTFLLNEKALSDSLIKKLLPSIRENERSEIKNLNLSSLSFNFTDKSQTISKDITNFDFELTGNLFVEWKPDLELLKKSLVGKHKNEVNTIFKQDPGIVSAKVSIIPFWSKILPKDTKNINIIIK